MAVINRNQARQLGIAAGTIIDDEELDHLIDERAAKRAAERESALETALNSGRDNGRKRIVAETANFGGVMVNRGDVVYYREHPTYEESVMVSHSRIRQGTFATVAKSVFFAATVKPL
jgi:hypothetical protein